MAKSTRITLPLSFSVRLEEHTIRSILIACMCCLIEEHKDWSTSKKNPDPRKKAFFESDTDCYDHDDPFWGPVWKMKLLELEVGIKALDLGKILSEAEDLEDLSHILRDFDDCSYGGSVKSLEDFYQAWAKPVLDKCLDSWMRDYTENAADRQREEEAQAERFIATLVKMGYTVTAPIPVAPSRKGIVEGRSSNGKKAKSRK